MSQQGLASHRDHIRRHALAVLVLGLGVAAGSPALAQSEQRLMVDVGPCVDIQSTLERFECYESRVEAARDSGGGASTSPSRHSSRETIIPSPSPRPEPEQRQQTADRNSTRQDQSRDVADEDSFGLQERRREEREEEKRQELRSTITALEETVPNSYLITLENGQVWRQMRPERYRIQVGHDVRIYPSPFGSSFRLSADELRGFIQVERVK